VSSKQLDSLFFLFKCPVNKMIQTLLGIKGEMSQGYDSRGRRTGVTKIVVSPNVVTQVKTTEGKDGYNAIQLALGTKKSVRKPQMGHFQKANAPQNLRFVKEIRSDDISDLSLGKEVKVTEIFKIGDIVKVTGISKGKGFQGGMKRHGFHGGPKTHGQSDRHRAPGSIGTGTTPGRVLKGKKMAGHMGSDTVSVKNLEIVGLDRGNNILLVKGGIPGSKGAMVKITRLGLVKGYTPPPEPEPEEELPSDVEQMEGGQTVEQATAEVIEEAKQSSEVENSETTSQASAPDQSAAAPEPIDEAAAADEVVAEAPAAEVSPNKESEAK
jgi:large subunit ribosomal protein L3